MKLCGLVALLALPSVLGGVLTQPCVLTKVMMARQSPIWKCLVDADDYDGRPNHKLEVLGLSSEDLSNVVSGVTVMTAEGAQITGRTIDVSNVSNELITPSDASGFNTRMVARKVLAIRAISQDGANSLSASELIDNVFTDSVNMIERYASCSYDKLTFSAFSGNLNGKTITDGMYEVTVNENTNGVDEGEAEGFIIDQLNVDLGGSFMDQIDHLMIFVPSNVPSFGANAEFNGKISTYDSFDASIASVTHVHEIGHNLHLDHSSEGDEEYGDDTCSMGFGLDIDDFRVCFNPPKSWTLGWYADKHVSLDVSAAGAVEQRSLVGVAEYLEAGSNSLFVKLDNGGNDYYIGFNRAVGINADQIEAIDQVTVQQTAGDNEFSYLKAKLSQGEKFTIDDIKNSGRGVDIEVISITTTSTPGIAQVRITNKEQNPPTPSPPTPSPPTANPPTDGGEEQVSTFCFSAGNLVSVSGKGEVGIDLLEIGDYVSSSRGFSRVFGFLHLQRDLVTDFLQITSQGTLGKVTRKIEVSAKHLLFSDGRTIAAGHVRVGSVLDGAGGEVLEVTSINVVKRKGVYAPVTESGDIIVSGFLASNYVDLLSTSAINHHTMSHALIAPRRSLCRMNIDWCTTETYTAEGYSDRIKVFIVISTFLNTWSPFVQYGLTLLIAPIVAFQAMFELIFRAGLPLLLLGFR